MMTSHLWKFRLILLIHELLFIHELLYEKNKKEMVEYADKNYQAKHEFASQKEIYGADSKCNDKKTYQYALVTSLVKPVQRMEVNENSGRMQSTNHQLFFVFTYMIV